MAPSFCKVAARSRLSSGCRYPNTTPVAPAKCLTATNTQHDIGRLTAAFLTADLPADKLASEISLDFQSVTQPTGFSRRLFSFCNFARYDSNIPVAGFLPIYLKNSFLIRRRVKLLSTTISFVFAISVDLF